MDVLALLLNRSVDRDNFKMAGEDVRFGLVRVANRGLGQAAFCGVSSAAESCLLKYVWGSLGAFNVLRPGFIDDVKRSLRSPTEAGEPGGGDHFFDPCLAGLRAQTQPHLLGSRAGGTQ